MICTGHLALSLLTLSAAAIAGIFVFKGTHLPDANCNRKPPVSRCKKNKPSSHCSAGSKDIISKLPSSHSSADNKDIISNGSVGNKDIISNGSADNKDIISNGYAGNKDIICNGSAGNKDFICNGSAGNKDIICNGSAGNKDFICNGSAGNKDFISKLPDDILISIISHVSLKCAIRTSVLSKRWRNLYRYVFKIELGCRHFLGPLSSRYLEAHDTNLLIDSLNNFIRLHTGSQILVFELTCCFQQLTTDRVKSCFHSLGRLGVEKIALNCGCYYRGLTLNFYLDLLSELLCLKYFKLSNCNLFPSLSSFQCNSLEILWLNGATIHPGAVECILSSCLRLHSLRIIDCRSPSKLCFCGPHLQLTTLLVRYCKGVKDIELYATNLVLFEFWSLEPANFIFDHVPKLNHMYYGIKNNTLMPHDGGNFLEDLPHLKSLNFDARGYDFQEAMESVGFINIFSNLSRLNLSLYLSPGINLLFMAPLLQSCPLLEEFQLNKQFHTTHEPNGRQEKRQPMAFHSQLKKMEISGFDGTEDELEFALYILKSAVKLETMHIIRCYKRYLGYAAWSNVVGNPWSEEIQRMILTKLQGQAISETAQVIIRHEVHVDSDRLRQAEDDPNVFFGLH